MSDTIVVRGATIVQRYRDTQTPPSHTQLCKGDYVRWLDSWYLDTGWNIIPINPGDLPPEIQLMLVLSENL